GSETCYTSSPLLTCLGDGGCHARWVAGLPVCHPREGHGMGSRLEAPCNAPPYHRRAGLRPRYVRHALPPCPDQSSAPTRCHWARACGVPSTISRRPAAPHGVATLARDPPPRP